MHPYSKNCLCEYCTTMTKILEQYSEAKKERFAEAYDADPFPPKPTINKYYCRACQLYHPKDYEHTTTGRFKVHHPPYETKARVRHWTGKHTRAHDKATDRLNWLYQPWPGAEPEVYFAVTFEAITKVARGNSIAYYTKKWLLEADEALREKRFYKVERIDTPAQT